MMKLATKLALIVGQARKALSDADGSSLEDRRHY
jgi:hypothetical protein